MKHHQEQKTRSEPAATARHRPGRCRPALVQHQSRQTPAHPSLATRPHRHSSASPRKMSSSSSPPSSQPSSCYVRVCGWRRSGGSSESPPSSGRPPPGVVPRTARGGSARGGSGGGSVCDPPGPADGRGPHLERHRQGAAQARHHHRGVGQHHAGGGRRRQLARAVQLRLRRRGVGDGGGGPRGQVAHSFACGLPGPPHFRPPSRAGGSPDAAPPDPGAPADPPSPARCRTCGCCARPTM